MAELTGYIAALCQKEAVKLGLVTAGVSSFVQKAVISVTAVGYASIREAQAWRQAGIALPGFDWPAAMAFFHMPPAEFKEAYEKMKLGDHSVVYEHGSIGEKDEYFGISNRQPHFFEAAVQNGWLKWKVSV